MEEEKRSLFKLDKINWRHYFAGFGFLIIILQLLTGLYLVFFFEPYFAEAYNSIRLIANRLFLGDIMRNLHRWIPALLFIAIIIHTARSFLRSDYRHPKKKVLWLTGVLLVLPLFLLVVTGLIVPWDWKGYWFLEMIPNYFETLPVIGGSLKAFFLESFTIPRYYVVHILVLPIITFILVDYHILVKLRRRGIFRYLFKHTLACLPFLVLLLVLAIYFQLPSNDPEEVPMPLEGAWVLSPEWYFLAILLPFMYLKGIWIALCAIAAPLLSFIAFAFMPYYLKSKGADGETSNRKYKSNALKRLWHNMNNSSRKRKAVNAVLVTFITLILSGLLLMGNYNSPTYGCNSCHSLNQGMRMGVPAADFRDRKKLPKLEDNEWMMGHWFYPTQIW